MKVRRDVENALFTLIEIKPWPDDLFSAGISVLHTKRDVETGEKKSTVRVRFGNAETTADDAMEYAQALLRAIDIAKRIETEGSIILEGEDEHPTVSLPQVQSTE